MNEINVFDLVGKNAISMQSGTIFYNTISGPILSQQQVILDFSNIELFASPFFNASIGLLLKDIAIEDLQKM